MRCTRCDPERGFFSTDATMQPAHADQTSAHTSSGGTRIVLYSVWGLIYCVWMHSLFSFVVLVFVQFPRSNSCCAQVKCNVCFDSCWDLHAKLSSTLLTPRSMLLILKGEIPFSCLSKVQLRITFLHCNWESRMNQLVWHRKATSAASWHRMKPISRAEWVAQVANRISLLSQVEAAGGTRWSKSVNEELWSWLTTMQ